MYVSLGLSGQHVGVEERLDGFVYVWFLDRPLGRFAPGKDESVLPSRQRPGGVRLKDSG